MSSLAPTTPYIVTLRVPDYINDDMVWPARLVRLVSLLRSPPPSLPLVIVDGSAFPCIGLLSFREVFGPRRANVDFLFGSSLGVSFLKRL